MDKKWAVVFLIYVDFIDEEAPKLNKNLLLELNSMLKDVIECDLDKDKLNVYIILSSVNYTIQKGRDQFELKRSAFIFKMQPQKGENKIIPIGDVDNVQQEDKLAKAFRTITDDEDFGDSEVFLITWDHGSAFGIFKANDKHPQVLETWPEISKDRSLLHLNEFIKVADTHLQVDKQAARRASDDRPSFIVNNKVYSASDNSVQSRNIVNVLSNKLAADLFSLEETNTECLVRLREDDMAVASFIHAATSTGDSANDFVELAADLDEFVSGGTIFKKTGFVEILTNVELSEAIRKGFGSGGNPGGVVVLLMMNCFMMNLHTVYTMKDCVDFLVAPQGVISFPGYNYKAILKYIFDNSGDAKKLTAALIAKECVDTCHNREARNASKEFRKLISNNFASIDEWSIFSIGLRNQATQTIFLDSVVQRFETLIERLKRDDIIGELKFLLFFSRKFSFDFSDDFYHMTDIFQWLRNVEFCGDNGLISTDIKGLISPLARDIFMEFSKRSVWYYSWQGRHYASNTLGAVTRNAQSGLSIFFPDVPLSTIDNIPFFNFTKDQLIDDHVKSWKEFISILTIKKTDTVSSAETSSTIDAFISRTSAGKAVSKNLPVHESG